MQIRRNTGGASKTVIAAAIVAALAVAPSAFAHVERASYWPDPAPDNSITPSAGGAVPEIRGLFSALDKSRVGRTRVVCQGVVPNWRKVTSFNRKRKQARRYFRALKRADAPRHARAKALRRVRFLNGKYRANLKRVTRNTNRNPSIRRLRASLYGSGPSLGGPQIEANLGAGGQARSSDSRGAVAHGYSVRPSEPPVQVTKTEAAKLMSFNKRLLRNCGFKSIQGAVTASGNNDRVVVMPGIYTEPASRAAPTNDPRCADLKEQNDRGNTGANSYRYVATCINDQSLIAVIGRRPGGIPPQPPLDDRHGIPDLGPCIRCNFQLEGSGIRAVDVIVDGGRVASGNGSPADPAKDVGIRADRADGFVLTNMAVRHVREHGIYVHETDGYVLDRFKGYQAEEYAVLTFTSDHGLIQDCETTGSGDAGIYPGSAPDSGEESEEPGGFRYNTLIQRCDMHHNAAGYSGTAANAVHLRDNDFYDNALGFTTDVFTAAGHPGFPQDSTLLENNEFYSNNFNPYVEQNTNNLIHPTIPVPVGTGAWVAGGNNNIFRNNRFWDNWRRGIMIFAVPDAFVCGELNNGNQQHGCDPGQLSTSYRNRVHNNTMGRSPAGAPDPNGVDFWWDSFATNSHNCWYDNTGPDGTRDSVAAEPPLFAAPGVNVPGFLPEVCDATSQGTVNGGNETELISCLANFDQDAPTPCTWFETPSEPAP